jgi:hypothetical protein
MLSNKAKEVISVLEKVSLCKELENFIDVDEEGTEWLPVTNILNGWVEGVSEETKALLSEVSDVLDSNLIGERGHSETYYELKNAGYSLRTGESDTWGPLSAVIIVPNTNWNICYG